MKKLLFPLTFVACLTGTAHANGLSGSYLAARQASMLGDYTAAADYYAEAVMYDPMRPELLERTAYALMGLGDFERAASYADKLEREGHKSQIAHMSQLARHAKAGAFTELLEQIDADRGAGPLADGLIRGWAELGRGEIVASLAAFDAVAKQRGMEPFAAYHKALVQAAAGDYAASAAALSDMIGNPFASTRRAVIAHAQILSQSGDNTAALAAIEKAFGNRSLDPGLNALVDQLRAGESVPFTIAATPRDGIAEVFFSLTNALATEANEDFLLMYVRFALFLRPDHVDAILLTADLLETMEQYDLAVETYKTVPEQDPSFHAAELGRVGALRRSGKDDAAIEVLEQLRRSHPDLPEVHTTLADLQRNAEDFEKAVASYDAALALSDPDETRQWFIHYARGISLERLGRWDEAEAGFRTALELNPDQPQVLNYLGYSLVQRQEKLDEALKMIQSAVAASPNSGYIVDSLGWVYYRLGRYDEAIEQMERAVELMPVDPIVNDHLGDVLWAVGRHLEAEFQWKRAISFVEYGNAAEEADVDRIRRKLEIGLDAVLAEEGAPPLKLAVGSEED